jgi:hypothetical protein
VADASGEEIPSASRIERLWRARKDSRTLDAYLLTDSSSRPASGDVEIRLYYEGEFLYERQWPSRELAVQDATEKLKALQIAGWATHW